MTENRTEFLYTIFIVATPDVVWRGLTDPEFTARYWSHENVSDWRPGSKWEHQRLDKSGADIVGKVIESDPPRRLVITWVRPKDAASPDAASRVTFEIVDHGRGVTKLMLWHEELEPGSDMDRGIREGWPMVLSNLKTLLETGKSATLW